MDMGMDSYFWSGSTLEDFLFRGLTTNSWTSLFGLCIGLVSTALLYEGLHFLKHFFLRRFLTITEAKRSAEAVAINNRVPHNQTSEGLRQTGQNIGAGEAPRSLLEETNTFSEDNTIISSAGTVGKNGFLDLTISSLLHSIYVFIGFTLMNAVMTFNVWIMLSICLGIGLGYFLFGNDRRADNLLKPVGSTENTSLNESSEVETHSSPHQGGGDAEPKNLSSRKTWSQPSAANDPSECSRLIVGAEVHSPRIISSPAC